MSTNNNSAKLKGKNDFLIASVNIILMHFQYFQSYFFVISVKLWNLFFYNFCFIIECIKRSQSKYATSIFNQGLTNFANDKKFRFFYLEFCNLSFPFDPTRSSISSILHCSSRSLHQFYLFSSQTLSLINIIILRDCSLKTKEVTEFDICIQRPWLKRCSAEPKNARHKHPVSLSLYDQA